MVMKLGRQFLNGKNVAAAKSHRFVASGGDMN